MDSGHLRQNRWAGSRRSTISFDFYQQTLSNSITWGVRIAWMISVRIPHVKAFTIESQLCEDLMWTAAGLTQATRTQLVLTVRGCRVHLQRDNYTACLCFGPRDFGYVHHGRRSGRWKWEAFIIIYVFGDARLQFLMNCVRIPTWSWTFLEKMCWNVTQADLLEIILSYLFT